MINNTKGNTTHKRAQSMNEAKQRVSFKNLVPQPRCPISLFRFYRSNGNNY